MKITERGATTLWNLIIRCAEIKHFAILFLDDNLEGKAQDERATNYWEGVAAFLREWADVVEEYASKANKKK